MKLIFLIQELKFWFFVLVKKGCINHFRYLFHLYFNHLNLNHNHILNHTTINFNSILSFSFFINFILITNLQNNYLVKNRNLIIYYRIAL